MKPLSKLEDRINGMLSRTEWQSGRTLAKRFKLETGREISYGTLYLVCAELVERGLAASQDTEDDVGPVRSFKRV